MTSDDTTPAAAKPDEQLAADDIRDALPDDLDAAGYVGPHQFPDDIRDALPDDLDAAGYVGPHQFPDNSRRRWPGVIYLVIAATAVVVWAAAGDAPVVNDGWLIGAIVLAAVGVFSISSSWRMHVDEKQALVAAHGAVGFPVGHASAQQVWRGLRSRPTWRVLCYSADEPPSQRGLVLVDAVDGHVVEHLVQDNVDALTPG